MTSERKWEQIKRYHYRPFGKITFLVSKEEIPSFFSPPYNLPSPNLPLLVPIPPTFEVIVSFFFRRNTPYHF